jgi:Tol biopolymer transport system component
VFLVLACSQPSASAPTSVPVNVETIVAQTLSALTAPVAQATPLPASSSLLPHSIYYLGYDSANHLQIFRLEKDGKTTTQLTSEPADIMDFDVSPIDGSVVFVSNNQLINVSADGSNRAMLFDGGAVDANNPFLTQVRKPIFSPNGETIAFGHKGLNFYSIVSGQANLVLPDSITDQGNGFIFPEELVWPEKYSPDGNKLFMTFGYYEGASTGIYYLNGGGVVRLSGGEAAIICCGDYALSPDASALFAASPTFGMFNAGLWKVDTATGVITTLLSGNFDTNPTHAADEPFVAPDGSLYFFYAAVNNTGEIQSRLPLQIVRSDIDGVTNRTVLRPETFQNMNEALWAPDASFVIVANAEIADIFVGGAAQLFYTDGQKGMIPLVKFALDMKWGQ